MHEYIIFISNFLIVFWLILQMITYKSNCCKPSYMESFKKCTLVKKKLKKKTVQIQRERYSFINYPVPGLWQLCLSIHSASVQRYP